MADQTDIKRHSFFSARARGWHVDAFWMFLSLVIVLVLWEALVAAFGFPAHLLPRPLAVVYSVIDHWGTIVDNAWTRPSPSCWDMCWLSCLRYRSPS